MMCSEKCEHLRSFRYGFGGERILAPYDKRDKLAGCALKPEITLHMRSYPVCWRDEDAE